MTYLLIFFVGSLLLIAAGFAIKHTFDIIHALFNYFLRDFVNRHLLVRSLKPKYKEVLHTYFRFYHTLSGADKLLFERRVQKFINMKEFIPRGGLPEVTPEMKALIAATAIQITFGYPSVYFEHFWRILVYPDNYYSSITRKYHQGEVNLKGIIVLSWSNFIQGFIDPDDGRNLGYHEMAHALRFENGITNNEYGFIDDDALLLFNKLARVRIDQIQNGQSHFLRPYATTNIHEFFAVTVEVFLENPEQLYREDPELYRAAAAIMKQNPIGV